MVLCHVYHVMQKQFCARYPELLWNQKAEQYEVMTGSEGILSSDALDFFISDTLLQVA